MNENPSEAELLAVGVPDELVGSNLWLVEQTLDDPNGDGDWRIVAVVDVDATDEANRVVLHIVDVGPR